MKVEASDSGGSGISGDPVLDFHIGDNTDYDGYEAMKLFKVLHEKAGEVVLLDAIT